MCTFHKYLQLVFSAVVVFFRFFELAVGKFAADYWNLGVSHLSSAARFARLKSASNIVHFFATAAKLGCMEHFVSIMVHVLMNATKTCISKHLLISASIAVSVFCQAVHFY
jgi:hypothetical protein